MALTTALTAKTAATVSRAVRTPLIAGPVQPVLSLCQLLVVPGPATLHDLLPP